MQDDMQAERRASRPPADEVIEVLSSDGDEEGSTERDDAGGSEDGDDEDGEEEEEEEPVEGEDFEEEEVLEEPEEDSVRFPTRSPFTPGEVIEIDSDSIMDDRSDRYRSPPERVDELEQREDEELYESEPTPEPVEVQQIEDDQMFETDKKPSPSAVYLPDVEVLEPIESDPQVIAVPAIEVEETEAVSIQTNLPVPEIMEAKAAQAIAEISSTKEPVIDSATRPAQEEQEMDDDAEQQQLQVVVELTGSERPAETPCAAELSVEAIREVEPDTTIVTETLGVAIEESDDIPPGNDGSYATRGSESHDQPNQPRVAEHEDYVHESLPEQETACAVALVPVLEEDISEADARARTIEREEVEMPQADDAAASGALPVSDEPVDSGFRDEAIHVPSAELVAFPRSEEHEIYEQGILPAVNATSAILVAELPNPHLAPPDTNMPIPFLFRDPVLKPTPTPSLFVEPPAPPPRPDAVSDVPLREESPVEMPDPGLPPPDSILPGPLRPQDLEPSDSPTPSMVVEPPFYPPVPDSVGANVVRADTPPFLPDARSAPPDTTAETPTLPSEVYNRSPTPSLVVEPADDTTIPTALTTFIRAESPPHTPDSFVAPPDAERIMPEVQHALDPVSLRSESMIVHAPNQQPRPTGEPEPVEFEDEPRMAVQEDETQLPPVHETSADADPPMKLYDQPAEASEPIASRLRHHHGDLGEAQDPATAAPAHQTRSRANSSASLMPTPPVTRSHCFYRKLRVSDDDLTAVVLVPQCTMADAARLHESQWEEAGEPTAEEEKDARPRSMTDLHPLLHPRLAIKLHRIVGKNVFGEGHCFLLYAGVGAFAQAFGHIPSPRKRKAADLQTPMDDDDIAFHVQTTPATKQARTTRSGKRGKSAASPETSATAVRRSQRRNLARSMSKTTSIATDDEEKRDLTPTPVAKSPSVNHSIFAASQRRTRASSIKQAEVTKDHSETEREITPVPSASTRKRKPRQSNPKGELVQPAESSESETEREDLPESSASPTKRKPRQSAAIIEQSVASSGLEQARGDTPMSAIQAAPLPPTSSKRKPRRSAAAEKADLPEDGEHGGDREMTPTPEAAASRRKPRKTGPTRKTADDEAETDRDTTPTKVIKSPPKPISLPAQSTRKRKLRLSIAGAKDVDPWRDLEGVEADEEESSASPAVRETRSMKRRAVDLPGAPDVPVPEGEDAAGDGQIQVETMTIETPRRTRRGIFGKMLAWRDRR